ncbi:b, exonuclease domain protein, DNA polymerase family [Trichuris suis]|nr:b, exonuclease domain protein, DNA polymerase family [Trichuris suis]
MKLSGRAIGSEVKMSKETRELKTLRANIEHRFGYDLLKGSVQKTAWLINCHATELTNSDGRSVSAVEYYFIEGSGGKFKLLRIFKPYFYIAVQSEYIDEFASSVSKIFSGLVESSEVVWKNDLELANHLSGVKRCYVKLNFLSVSDLVSVRNEIMRKLESVSEPKFSDMDSSITTNAGNVKSSNGYQDYMDYITHIREYDIPYHVRVAIDTKIFVGMWYNVTALDGKILEICPMKDMLSRPVRFISAVNACEIHLLKEPSILAFDIECTKAALKFPDPSFDNVMMISYMVNGQGFLIINRAVVSEDIEDFEYTPKPQFEGHFTVFNEADELALLGRFFDHFQRVAPDIVVTYNGDAFDWPFIDARASALGLDLYAALGFRRDKMGEYKSRQCSHMDVYRWVKRDSYLPMGSHNLKACTRMKLGYDPVDLDPEDLVPMAREEPQTVASYSVSDAVATYYLYMTYVHPFIFSLCTIIPMEPDEVLRKGSGTLCEALLMVEAFSHDIVFPNKKGFETKQFTTDGHLIMSETYVGGHVEALECGVFKADIPYEFHLNSATLQLLIDGLSETVQYACSSEGVSYEDVENFSEVCDNIRLKLTDLRDSPDRTDKPLIYHLDVGAMYPNIILTNRLQPSAVVNESICAKCIYNRPDAKCQKIMDWVWRGEILPANRSEYRNILHQLSNERFASSSVAAPKRYFHALSNEEKQEYENRRLKNYCRKAYGRNHDYRTEVRKTTICQREHSFYVDTIRAFRDRRYEYKCLQKKAKRELEDATANGDFEKVKMARSNVILFESLQIAHKCILNSFYGYVMRRGSRWHSMEMAGIVCHTGAQIIKKARMLIEHIGKPLELDTDGIWCMLPSSFPEKAVLKLKNGAGKVVLSYPAAVLNTMVRKNFTNDVYHVLENPVAKTYAIKSENTIAFEIDGPYQAMVLPSAKEEGKKLKKRYAVYNFDGSIAELKGFEVKRRGELQLIKLFQTSVFDGFLNGSSLNDVYRSVSSIANYWLDVLYSKIAASRILAVVSPHRQSLCNRSAGGTCRAKYRFIQGVDLPDSELFELISENRSLSRSLEDYNNQRSAPIVAAKRLAEFLGDEMIKQSGLNCRIVILKEPKGEPTSERAVPLAIFKADRYVSRHFLRRWLKRSDFSGDFEIREILDWAYYIDRLSSAVLKLVCIPAVLQGIPNPVPRVPLPDWVKNKVASKEKSRNQQKLTDIFKRALSKQTEINFEESEEVHSSPSRCKQKSELNGTRNLKRAEVPLISETEAPNPVNDSYIAVWLAQLKQRWLSERHEVCPTAERGLFTLWIMVANDLQSVKLRVPRIFYVNQRVPKAVDSGEFYKKVNRILPHGRAAQFLYEYKVPDAKFERHIEDLSAEMSALDIEGIYETNVPLLFRVLMQLGNVCQVKQDFHQIKIPDEFSHDMLEAVAGDESKYRITDRTKMLYVYCYAQDVRSIWGFINPISKFGTVWIVDRSSLANHPNIGKLYSQERSGRMKAHPTRVFPEDNYSFEVKLLTDVKEVHSALNVALGKYHSEKHGPTIVYFVAPYETDFMQALGPSFTLFPLVKLRVVEIEKAFSVLDWQRVGCSKFIVHFLNLHYYASTFESLCDHIHIPIGNVPEEPILFTSDLTYARYLHRNGCVLWCSSTDQPDFGGKVNDDVRLSTDIDDPVELQVNKPAFWKDVCVELEVCSFPLAALLQSSRVVDQNDPDRFLSFHAPLPKKKRIKTLQSLNSYDSNESIVTTESFRLLKVMVHDWLKAVTVLQDVFADNQLIHFYRWLGSPRMLLYDPALKQALDSLIKKLFLMVEISFISEIVNNSLCHADDYRANNRLDRKEATSHTNFIVKSLQAKAEFSLIGLNIIRLWKVLLWLDPNNFGGVEIACSSNGTPQPELEDESGLTMNWQIVHFLPTAYGCQTNFDVIISGYILAVHQFLLSENEARSDEFSDVSSSHKLGSEAMDNQLRSFSCKLVREELVERLFNIVRKIQRNVSVKVGQGGFSSLFPHYIGTYLNMNNPALELCKSLCHILSLDKCISQDVENLKRNLLKLIGVGEFSDEAEWQDPSLSLILPNFICKQCNMSRNLDLCRDFELSEDCTRETWFCPRCRNSYALEDIEFRLVQHLNNFSRLYFSQDVICAACDEVKEDHFVKTCSCGGRFKCTLRASKVHQKLAVYRYIAK